MFKKIKILTGRYHKKLTRFLLLKEIKNMRKSDYLTLAERMELHRDIVVLQEMENV